MSFTAEEIYDLLPAVHRIEDAAQGYPVKQLIEIIAAQVEVLEENLEQLYENHFVETAAPWALPYLGDLLGIRGLPSGTMAVSPRAEVANTIAYRRRKGTPPMLEMLARDVTGWPARAVEYFERLAATQHGKHLRPGCQSFASLRNAKSLELVGTPFESLTRTVEVRPIQRGRGRWNLPNVGLHLWRVRAFARTGSPLVPVGELWPGDPLGERRFRLHPLGLDCQLFIRPVTEDDITHLAEPLNVPLPLTRRMLAGDGPNFHPLEVFYGAGQSVVLQEFIADRYTLIPAQRVRIADLSDARDAADQPVWNHENAAAADQVLLDPQLGRIVLGEIPSDPQRLPLASFHYGFSMPLGGGQYARAGRSTANPSAAVQVPPGEPPTVPGSETVADALSSLGTNGGTVELTSSGRFVETLPDVNVNGGTLELRALDGSCPAIWLRPAATGQRWTISGDADGSCILDGLWLVGAMRISGQLQRFRLRHCTLAPGRTVTVAGDSISQPDAFLELAAQQTAMEIENCILPPLRVGNVGVNVRLRNCIIDAGAEDQIALSNLGGDGPAGTWRLENCTIIGNVQVDVLELASNCIFLSQSVLVRRRQEGCVRFSWFPSGFQTRVPRRYRCVSAGPGETAGIRPQFTSLRHGDPGYGQLSRRCSELICQGADDGAEMGAMHDLFQPQREAHLRVRLREYLRLGLAAGVFYES